MITLLDFLSAIPGPWLAFAGTLLGGTGIKILEYLLGRGKVKADIASELRNELRQDIKDLQARVDELEAENEKWRARAFKAEEEVAVRNALIASHGCMNDVLKPQSGQ
ncbi:hypothetical protein [Streptomyces lasalocidi]|uniref:Uncharacterized protein n=1 Tax=Streptomyces lasalocidi TaxID=324833 RepID=A0A4U5WP86_STRLS|nr:hypothetical protein [Streptomyces lasalocidi]TKT03452.1 hypothetical protein E4U91_27395 [Streptomyces lasalocidi]